ncbi:hypothetical protein D9M68_483930 [compost metagenome]
MDTGNKPEYRIAENEQYYSSHSTQSGKNTAGRDAQEYRQGNNDIGYDADYAHGLCHGFDTGCIIVQLIAVCIILHRFDKPVQNDGHYGDDKPVKDGIYIRQESLAPVKHILNNPVAEQHGNEIEERTEHVPVVTGYIKRSFRLKNDPPDDGYEDPFKNKRQYEK